MITSRLFTPFFAFVSMALLFVSSGFAEASGARMDMTPEEAAWLKAHPVIRHAPDPDYAPFEFRDQEGECVGIAPDYLELISRKLGARLETVHNGSWAASLENVKQRRADLVTVAARTPERSEYMLFTSPYIRMPDVILVRDEVRGDLTMEDLKGKTVAAIKAWAANDYIREKYPEIRLKMVPDVKSALLETSLGSVDATVLGLATASYTINKIQITNLRIAGESGYAYELRFGSRDDWPQLNRLLEKALKSITEEERAVIYNKWISVRSRGWRPGPKFWIFSGVALSLVIIIGALIWNWRLRKKVDAGTAELRSELMERRRVQGALGKKSEELALLLNNIDTQIWYLTDTTTYGAVNKAHAEFNG
ncbi:MAG: transporter substrate-binding domain-containing protein, partial [Desulfobacterales bacterium]|nr:transporter substrate-binding domain-containing protein [Desulfobacterales bacterium]